MADVVRLLREASGEPDEDVATFVDSLAFNWLVGGTDAHAKNFSLLIGAGGRARLAPLYDIASVLPYQGAALHKVKLAMKIGGKYRPREIGSHEWRKLAGTLRLDPDETVHRVRRIAEEMPDLVVRARRASTRGRARARPPRPPRRNHWRTGPSLRIRPRLVVVTPDFLPASGHSLRRLNRSSAVPPAAAAA